MEKIGPYRSGQMIQALLKVLADGGLMRGQQVVDGVRKILPPTEFELGEYESRPGKPRFDTIIRFKTIGPVKAGWMTKGRPGWQITDDGRDALAQFSDPLQMWNESNAAYRRWAVDQPDSSVEDAADSAEDNSLIVSIEQAEETAWDEIEAYIRGMPPYEFQNLVSALLKAMGYHVPWVSPPGKDGGIDIIAYTDPLGALGPRIKVQVKRHNTGSVGAADLRSFLAVLGQQDVGIYVATNGFSTDAQKEARTQETRRVMLIDLDRLVELWVQHYENLSDADQAMLPVRPVYFLARPS